MEDSYRNKVHNLTPESDFIYVTNGFVDWTVKTGL